jgi:hypothetical protein
MGTPKTTGAKKMQGRHRCKNSIGTYGTKPLIFIGGSDSE